MNDSQRDAGVALLRAGLSARGLQQTRDIMRLNHTLAEMDHDDFDTTCSTRTTPRSPSWWT